MSDDELADRTVEDFGDQWTRFQDNSDYYGSAELFDDIFGPLLRREDLRSQTVAEIGAGTGRFVKILLDAGVTHVVAVEPSKAMDVLMNNTRDGRDRITYLRVTGDRIPADLQLDCIFSIGVLHHIPQPAAVVRAAFRALKPGGVFCAWVYGYEGNRAYLIMMRPMRAIARLLPHSLLMALVWSLYGPLHLYIRLAHVIRAPLHDYMTRVLGRLPGDKVRLVVYDQLKPTYAKYYQRDELVSLLADSGYVDIQLHHRHGYSWAAVAVKP